MIKNITLTLKQARSLLGKDSAMDELIRANFMEEELNLKVMKWKDLGYVSGYLIDASEEWDEYVNSWATTMEESKIVFATQNQARSCLAMAQLSQLMKHVNGDWKPDWKGKGTKWCIQLLKDEITVDEWLYVTSFLAFPTECIAKEFLETHRELIEEYFLIYQ